MICGFQHLERNTWLFEKEIYREEFITQFRRNAVTCVFIVKQLERLICHKFLPWDSRGIQKLTLLINKN